MPGGKFSGQEAPKIVKIAGRTPREAAGARRPDQVMSTLQDILAGAGGTTAGEHLHAVRRRSVRLLRPENASVSMLTEGTLMRLAKEDFRKLLNEPMLEWVDLQQAQAIVARGGKWLDVRLPSEFENYHMEGAINLPLYFIRLKLKSLERNVPYVVCCDTGRRSSAGAYILSERGFQASVLKGGLAATDVKRS